MQADSAIIARVLAGDHEAFGILVERHHGRCLQYARHVLQDADEAQDVTQEAFVRAYRALDKCEHPDRFEAWLFRILVNRVRTAIEKRSTRARWFVRLEDDDALESVEEESSDPPSLETLEDALRGLSAKQREALLLKYGEGVTYEEMASMTGSSVSALKMRVNRAIEVLRAKMLVKR
jgi:RNA polymerase sigma-70 factor (ECF subfamily)